MTHFRHSRSGIVHGRCQQAIEARLPALLGKPLLQITRSKCRLETTRRFSFLEKTPRSDTSEFGRLAVGLEHGSIFGAAATAGPVRTCTPGSCTQTASVGSPCAGILQRRPSAKEVTDAYAKQPPWNLEPAAAHTHKQPGCRRIASQPAISSFSLSQPSD